MLIYLPQLICSIGLVLWLLSNHPKASEAGRIMFFCGLLATCFNGIKW